MSLWDASSIAVGIIIGSSIYCSTPMIAQQVPSVGWLVAIWTVGAVFTFIGALCYAELATAYPKAGGDYVFLTEAFGRKLGFLFAWGQFWIVRPGTLGTTAFVYADYANRVFALPEGLHPVLVHAVLAIVVLTAINLLGIRTGKTTQNLLTLVKFFGLLAIVVAGLSVPTAAAVAEQAEPLPLDAGRLAFAMIFIFYAYSGWNEMAYVSSEVRNPRKNILWALALSTVAVVVLYIAVNLAFVHALGLDGLRSSKTVAANVLSLTRIGDGAGKCISVLICITALGGINGMIFTGARIFYAVGTEHRLFSWLGRWSSLTDTPARPLIIQAVATVAVIVGFGWMQQGNEGFEDSVVFTAPIFWVFLLLVGASLFVLRVRGRRRGGVGEDSLGEFRESLPTPARAGAYRVPLYPVLPLLFCLSSGYMFYRSLDHAIQESPRGLLASIGVLAIGTGLAFWEGGRTPRAQEVAED
jgi:APA family basic amino acid/polyamine antiporter